MCFLGVLTIFSAPMRYAEAFGLCLIEAMASGVPVVNPGGSTFEEIALLTGGGKTVPPRDPSALACAWEELLADPDEAAAMGERGRRGVEEHYSVTAMKDGFVALAERACANLEPCSS